METQTADAYSFRHTLCREIAVNLLLPLTKRGRLRVAPFLVTMVLLSLVLGALTVGLALAWSRVWVLFVILQALVITLVAYLVARRPLVPASITIPSSMPVSTGLVDELTRTLNRRGITSSLIEAMAQSQRYGTPLAIASLKIDGVPALIERLGDDALAAILEATSAVLGEALRLPDRLGRYQDHEFLVVLPQTRAEQAVLVAERLRTALMATPVKVKGEEATITLSGGVAEFGRGQDLERFLGNAHAALQEADQEGGNGVRLFHPPGAD